MKEKTMELEIKRLKNLLKEEQENVKMLLGIIRKNFISENEKGVHHGRD